jgi:hypothetical protein
MRPPREDTLPWYRQFWPWFLISLPASVVVASLVTINLAIRSDDGLVSDDYYKKGLAIHMDAERTARARALGIVGSVDYQPGTGAVVVAFGQRLPRPAQRLELSVVHPTIPDRDQAVMLTAVDALRYAGRLEPLTDAHWKLELRPEQGDWRITGRLALPGDGRSSLN